MHRISTGALLFSLAISAWVNQNLYPVFSGAEFISGRGELLFHRAFLRLFGYNWQRRIWIPCPRWNLSLNLYLLQIGLTSYHIEIALRKKFFLWVWGREGLGGGEGLNSVDRDGKNTSGCWYPM